MSNHKNLSIAHIHWGFPPTIGGVETHLALMLPEMVKAGHRVSLLTGSFEGEPFEGDYCGVKLYRNILMDLNWLVQRGLGGLEKEVRRIFNDFLDNSKPDIVHAHNMHYFKRVHTLSLFEEVKKRGIPLLLTAHNVWDDALFLELTRDMGWDHIIAVSHYIRHELIGVGCNPEKVTTIHHGIDTKKFKPGLDTAKMYERYPQLKGKKVIFHPARMGLGKGCDLSIKALNIIKKRIPDAYLMMAGSKNIIDWGGTQGPEIAYFVDLVNHFCLQNDVLIDSYELDDMPYLYNLCDVVIYPSTAQEPFGMTMLESMACKKPIIVTQSGGMPEIVKEDNNGYLIPIKNFDALADRIIRLLSNPELRNRLGENGYEMIQNNYKEGHVAETTLAVYEKLLTDIS